jgi:hypothetical protein
MAKAPTSSELAQDRAESVAHLMARPEIELHRSRYLRTSAIATSISATAAAVAAIVAPVRKDDRRACSNCSHSRSHEPPRAA